MNSNSSGMYIGVCVENNDPLKLGRIKVRVPIIYGNIPIEDLPWAEPCFPYATEDQSIFFIPEKESFVTVWFLNGSKYKPIWVGGIHRSDSNAVPSICKQNYPKKKVIKTKTGYMYFDDKDYEIKIEHKNGSEIILKDNGDIVIHARNHVSIYSDDDDVTTYPKDE
jgi:hypothetical protein